jgi:nitrite reductase/ring-hydroxylating ferredoxin subunit/uncharacterized membrane protein
MSWLDKVSETVKSVTAPIAGEPAPKPLKDLLNGVWLGHPLHPLVVAAPIGAWTSALIFDLIEEDRAADTAILFGIAGGLASAATGAAQYYDATTNKEPRRLGALHAALNSAALASYVTSAVLRSRGSRGAGQVASALGLMFLSGGGLLGGDLAYTLGIGVDHSAFEKEPTKWVDVIGEAELPDGKPVRVEAKGAPVMLLRDGDLIHAVGATCTHLGGPMDEGEIDLAACTTTCPWHASVFSLNDGSVVHGPATVSLPSYEVKREQGRVLVRLEKRPALI